MKPTLELRPYTWAGPYAEMRAAHRAVHDPGLCADVRAAWMAPGERLIVRSSEIIADPAAFLYDDHLPPAEPEDRGGRYDLDERQYCRCPCI